jgi:transcriptional regulator GlxA family with amidase domain
LLVLGADALDASDQSAMEYLKAHHDVGGSILTVCTGAKFVASLGLLDGAEATTNSLFLETFAADYPRVEWVSLADNTQRRFVRSTKQIVTTAGITAGIDGSLEQIYEWCGFEVAEAIRECLEWPLPIEIAETTTSTTATTSATTTIGLGKNKSDGAIETDL